jgi:pyruvate,water dikinase
MTHLVVRFDQEGADKLELVGGKGANLGKLTQAALPVPPGFTVTTEAYSLFIHENQLDKRINDILARIRYDDADDVETRTAEIRDLIVTSAMPHSVAGAIDEFYEKLGANPYVAVRSSGTAEDLAEASFAGLHDTYLDIRGREPVLDAVKRCWASLWTARATAYRSNKGFNHFDARLAVVIQIMVEAEVAGVLFTGNPMTASSDEMVVNASWGLGEAVVSGIVTPDSFVLNSNTLKVKERMLGSKGLRIFRDPARAYGTLTEVVPELEQKRFTLNDDQLASLGEAGRQVTTYYHEIPQDIEWAFAKGSFYLLQSRPITGVEFAWNEALESWQAAPDDDEIIWSRSWADEVWTGAITPLMYSWRGSLYTHGHINCMKLWGMSHLASKRRWKYNKGTAYHNCEIEQELVKTAWSPFRAGLLTHTAPDRRDEVLKAPFNLIEYLRIHARIRGLEPSASVNKWIKYQYEEYINNPKRWAQADGLPDEGLRRLSDAELKRYIDGMIDLEREYFQDMWSGFFLHARDSMSLLGWMLANWYDGSNTMAFSDLITGVPKRTSTMEENLQLWRLSDQIRHSPELLALFRAHQGAAFFAKLEDSAKGKEFLEKYRSFAKEYGHRGQADRDIYYPRRIEDISIDYNAFQAFLGTATSVDPEAKEHEINQRRDAVIEDVVQNIRKKPLGFLKVEAFKIVLDYVHQFFMYRDNERHMTDRITFGGKRGFLELNRRLVERGIVETERDFFFLSREELYDLFDGRANTILTRSKIFGRMRDFDRFLNKDYQPPMYMKGSRTISFDTQSQDEGGGFFRGTGTSRGTIRGVARIVKSLKDIGRVKEGEILVTNSTDPGWTPVFMVISGIVLETGGMLAHGSCLAREYGLPAVQVENAMQLITDGAFITINGDSGELRVELEELVDA